MVQVVAGDEEGAGRAGGEHEFHPDHVVVVGGGALRRLAGGVELLIVAHDLKAVAAGGWIDDHMSFGAAGPGRIAQPYVAELHAVKIVGVQGRAGLVA